MSSSSGYSSRAPDTISEPADFDAFWHATMQRLAAIPVGIRRDRSEPLGTDLQLHNLRFQSWRHGTLHGYLLQGAGDMPRPLVIYTHGYNGRYEIARQWANQGVDVFGFDTRGFGRSLGAVAELGAGGWILSGIQSAEHSILRGAVCDYCRAVDVARQLLATPPSRTLFYGFSFGGAMAMMAAALRRDADYVAVGVPSFGWMAGRRRLVRAGSGKEVNDYLRRHPQLEQQVMNTLAYFDTANFAARVQAPTLIGLGLRDVVVPAATVRAISDRLQCPHQVMEFPVSHSDREEEKLWCNFEQAWLDLAVHGAWPKP